MQRSTFHILFGIVASMWLSLLYFLSLIIHLPVIATLILFLVMAVVGYRLLTKHISFPADRQTSRNKWLQPLILAIGIAVIIRSVLHQVYIHGSNDALGMWNYYARFLAADNWQQLFSVTGYYHPNHPLGLSSLVALGWRLSGSFQELWPVSLSLLSLLIIPVLIYTEAWRVNIPLAIFTLILFATDLTYHGYSFAQIADLPLALCLLGAFISVHHYQREHNSRLLFLCAALLGCCLWLKNEGMLLIPVFCLFYGKELASFRNLKYSLAGLLPFLFALLIYKVAYAQPNDLLQTRQQTIAQMLTNKAAYSKIFLYFRETLHSHFYVLQAAFLLYLIVQLVRRQWPERAVLCLTACLLGMLCVYLITPTDLDWQLGTSLSRVLFELMPSFTYCLIMAFSRMRLPGAQPLQQ